MSWILHALSIPHSALVSVIFGLMLVSFPLGAYTVFNTDMGDDITHRLPTSQLAAFGAAQHALPHLELGDVFVAAWTTYAMLFVLAMMGPGRDMASALRQPVFARVRTSNYMVQTISWFSVLVLASAAVDVVQGWFGSPMSPPDAGNDLVQFYLVTISPITEEAVFRVALVGLPVMMIYMHRASLWLALKALWHPARHLHIYDSKKMILVVLVAGAAFGAAHIIPGDTWGPEKLLQATAAGVILGYVYCKHGLVCAIMIHWASNYFLYSYGYFVAHVGDWDVSQAFQQPFFFTVQVILVAAGAITLAALIMERRAAPPPPSRRVPGFGEAG